MPRVLVNGGGTHASSRTNLPLSLLGIWRAFWQEPWSFKWTCIYVFFEYVRPQQVYESLSVVPWPRLAIIAAVASFLLEGKRVRSRTVANALLIALTIVVLLSSVFAYSPETAFGRLTFFANWLIAFFLIANTTTDQRKFYLFIVLYLLWSAKMSQFAARSFLTGGGSAGGAPGWFQNTGEFALQMCIYVPLALHFLIGLYPALTKVQVGILALLPITGTLGIINSGSRGGVLGLGCVGVFMLLQSKHKIRGLIALSVAIPAIWMIIPQGQKNRFDTAGQDDTSRTRLTYWKRGIEMANAYPFLGVGYENWVPYYADHYPPAPGEIVRYSAPGKIFVEVSHNSFVEVGSQLGYTGLVLFTGLLFSIWYINRRTRKLLANLGDRARLLRQLSYGLDAGVIGFIVAGFFMAVAMNPFVWFQLGMTAALNVAAIHLTSHSGASVKSQWTYPEKVDAYPISTTRPAATTLRTRRG
ncbi:O-antigen ligase family protein [Gemmatimonas sp.]|uniref:O-antigen ligase family protein n=1 Tax=Gemmatimonas sp. TaxID=1962908 RepID=UPI003DA34019